MVAVALAGGLLAASHAQANANASCCLTASSALSAYLNPPTGEDNTFFRQAAGGDATIAFVLMNRRRMLEFPLSMYEIRILGSADGQSPDDASATGCNNAYLNNLNYFYPRNTALAGRYQASRAYPRPEVAYSPSSVNTNAVDQLFIGTSFYRFLTWTSRGTSTSPSTTAAGACSGLIGLTLAQQAECASCLASRGYYLNPNLPTALDNGLSLMTNPQAGIFSGNFLNFYPPRYIMLRLALKRLMGDPRISRFRISVVTHTSDEGAVIREPFRPACGGNGTPTNSFTNGVDSVPFELNSNPIAEILFNMGEFHADPGRWHGGAFQLFSDDDVEKINDQGNLCRDCDKHFIALFSDGRGDGATPYCALGPTGVPRPCTRAMSLSCLDPTGLTHIEGDGDDYIEDGRTELLGGLPPRTPAGTCASDLADDVAGFLDRTDLGVANAFPGENTVQTYVIGVGSNSAQRMNILRRIAEAGGGDFYLADDYTKLEQGLDSMLAQMSRRATSFASASVSSFQVNAGGTGVVPRFRPNRQGDWRGFLYRWNLFSEFVEGVNKNASEEDPDDLDDVFITDVNNNIVIEDDDGVFRRKGSSELATPHWEAGAKLLQKGANARTIYTVIDTASSSGTGGPDNRLDSGDARIAFTEANAAQLLPYLALEGSPVCGMLQQALALSSLTQLECARLVIRYVRGKDVLDEDGDLDRNDDREWLLGDIFHSSPALVSNPVEPFLCDLGLQTQCVNTLYAPQLPVGATPLVSYPTTGTPIDAYEKYRRDGLSRERIVLVGANDGMVHAFHAGSPLPSVPPPTPAQRFPETHDVGTGEELWAFIPPDLLPKLKFRLNTEGRHHYFVDGDIMVRDIWADSNVNPDRKDAEEFHTLAVFSERRGGNHYFALDVTDPRDPRFRWLFPQPCSPEAQEVGETWMSLSPKAPPIGPVLLKKENGGIPRVIPPATQAMSTEERWTVFLQGGYDPNLNKGRGVYVLDAWSGTLLFKRQYDGPNGVGQALRFPVAAPVGLIDYGSGGQGQDGFFDTAIIADTGGQVHVLRFHEPGFDLNSDGLMDNWRMARSFEQGGSADLDLRERNPFFFLPSNSIDPSSGQLRTFLGSGDRYNVRDPSAGVCKVDNPYACGKYGCTWNSTLTVDTGGQSYTTTTTLSGGKLTTVSETTAGTSTSCSSFTGTQVDTVAGCAGIPSTPPRVLKNRSVTCGTLDGGYGCTQDLASEASGVFNTEPVEPLSDTGVSVNQYYGFWSYGKSMPQPDGGTVLREFSDDTSAAAFDQSRVREAALVDVTTGATAPPNSQGWRLRYGALAERTASGSGVLASCVLWNSLEFLPNQNSACSVGGTSQARIYQANILTGAADCADSFRQADGTYVRSMARNVITPPAEPTPKVSINAAGQIRYSLDSFDPGAPQAQSVNVQSSQDVMQLIYTLDVPPALHACRHAPTANGTEGRCE
jgi:type IV pilus assembly protein PilY1